MHERNIIHLCCSHFINDAQVLNVIDQYVKEYAKGITVYNNPYTIKYDFSDSQCERMYKYEGHGHPFSIVLRLLCEGDIMIINEELLQIVKQIAETPNKDIVDIRNVIRYFHSDLEVAKYIRRPSDLYLILQMFKNTYINLRSATAIIVLCQNCEQILRIEDGGYMHFVHQSLLNKCVDLQHCLSIRTESIRDFKCTKCKTKNCVYNHLIFNDNHIFIVEFSQYPTPPIFNTGMNVQLKVPINGGQDDLHSTRNTSYFLKYIVVFKYTDPPHPPLAFAGHYELIMFKNNKWFYFANKDNDDGNIAMKIFEMSLDEILATRFYVTQLVYIKQDSVGFIDIC